MRVDGGMLTENQRGAEAVKEKHEMRYLNFGYDRNCRGEKTGTHRDGLRSGASLSGRKGTWLLMVWEPPH